MTEEDMAAYKAFTAKYHVHFKPADLVEEQLVQTLADCQWRLNRYRSVENTILAIGFDKRSDMWIVDNPQTHGAFATADGYSYKTKDLATLGTQEQRVFRQYNQTCAKLEAMQTARKRQERIDLSHAANLYAMHQAGGALAQEVRDCGLTVRKEVEKALEEFRRIGPDTVSNVAGRRTTLGERRWFVIGMMLSLVLFAVGFWAGTALR